MRLRARIITQATISLLAACQTTSDVVEDDTGSTSVVSTCSSSTSTALPDPSTTTGDEMTSSEGTTSDESGSTAARSSETTANTTGVSGTARTVFVNFDGVTLLPGNPETEDATMNTSFSSEDGLHGEIPPLGDQAMQDQAMAILEEMLADFDVMLTTTRPERGPYTMIVVAPDSSPIGGNVTGIGDPDCTDDRNDVAFAWPTNGPPAVIAEVAAFQIGLA